MMHCQACNAELEVGVDACPVCGATMDSTPPPQAPTEAASVNPYESPIDVPVQRIPAQVSVPLAIGLLVVLVASFFISLGLGIALTLLAVPAYARTAGHSFQRYARGEVLTTDQRIVSFLGSLAVVGICLVAGGIAFFVTCVGASYAGLTPFGGGRHQFILTRVIWAASVVAAGVIYWMFWPRSRQRKTQND